MFSRFFIHRPIFASVLSIIITLGGGIAVWVLPVAQYPEITPPTVEVSAAYPGADAQVVADTVAAPIEQQVNGVEGMLYMSSQCTNDGTYTLTVTFKLGVDLNMAQVLVQNRVAMAVPILPDLVNRKGVTVKKKSPNVLMIVNLFSPPEPGRPEGSRNNLYLSNYATIQIRDELSRIRGVGDVTYLGERDYSMRIWLNPQEMAYRGLAAADVVLAVTQQNAQVAAGQIGQPPVPKGQEFQYTMTTLGRLVDPEQFADMIIKDDHQGRLVRLHDVARIELGAQAYDQTCTLNGRPSVALSVYQLPGSNALQTARLVRAKMEELKAHFTQGVDYKIVYDTTPFIKESIFEVFITLFDAVLLVAFVVLLFLQKLALGDHPPGRRAGGHHRHLRRDGGHEFQPQQPHALRPRAGDRHRGRRCHRGGRGRRAADRRRSAPAGCRAEGHGPGLRPGDRRGPGPQRGLRALRVHHRHHRQVLQPVRLDDRLLDADFGLQLADPQPGAVALLLRPREDEREQGGVLPILAYPFLGAVLTLRFVLTPWGADVCAACGLPGVNPLEDGFSPWLAMAAVSAGAIAFLVVAWPLDRFLAFLFRGFNAGFTRATEGYTRLVGMALRVSVLVLLVYGGLLALTYWGFMNSPSGFIPAQDKGYLLVNVQLPDAASVERTERVMRRIEELAHKNPGVKDTVAIAGQSILLGANAPNFGAMYVMLDDFHRRAANGLSGETIAAQLQADFREEIKDGLVNVLGAPPIDGLGTAGGFKIIVEDRGDNGLPALQKVGEKIVDDARRIPALAGLFSSFRADTPWLFLDIDRTQAKVQGVSMAEIFSALQVYLGSLYVNDFNRNGRTWQVNVQADAAYRKQVDDLAQLKVRNVNARMVPLATVAKPRWTSGPVMIQRYNMYVAAPVNGAPAPGVSSGEAIRQMEEATQRQLEQVHAMSYDWTELAKLQIETGNTAMLVFLLAVVLVFLVLAAQYESWSLPLAVILVVPMCLLCSIAGVAVAHMDVNIFTQIGFVVLVGLACKNAILIVEYAKTQREGGADTYRATLAACHLRLRPIMMTSFAFILGVVPLVVSVGAGAEMRRTLGTAVFAGMLGVTLFGIFLTPVFFYVIQWFADRRKAE